MKQLLRALFIGLVASTLTVACSQKNEEEAKVNPTDALEAANAKWNDAFNSGNAKELAALYAEDATVSPGNGQTLVGRAEIENLIKGYIDGGLHNHTLEVIEAGGSDEVIYQVARWSAQGGEVNGETPTYGGITTNILEQSADGTWLTRAHVWNAKP